MVARQENKMNMKKAHEKRKQLRCGRKEGAIDLMIHAVNMFM
jgi:hypothetical protein